MAFTFPKNHSIKRNLWVGRARVKVSDLFVNLFSTLFGHDLKHRRAKSLDLLSFPTKQSDISTLHILHIRIPQVRNHKVLQCP